MATPPHTHTLNLSINLLIYMLKYLFTVMTNGKHFQRNLWVRDKTEKAKQKINDD